MVIINLLAAAVLVFTPGCLGRAVNLPPPSTPITLVFNPESLSPNPSTQTTVHYEQHPQESVLRTRPTVELAGQATAGTLRKSDRVTIPLPHALSNLSPTEPSTTSDTQETVDVNITPSGTSLPPDTASSVAPTRLAPRPARDHTSGASKGVHTTVTIAILVIVLVALIFVTPYCSFRFCAQGLTEEGSTHEVDSKQNVPTMALYRGRGFTTAWAVWSKGKSHEQSSKNST